MTVVAMAAFLVVIALVGFAAAVIDGLYAIALAITRLNIDLLRLEQRR